MPQLAQLMFERALERLGDIEAGAELVCIERFGVEDAGFIEVGWRVIVAKVDAAARTFTAALILPPAWVLLRNLVPHHWQRRR